MDPVICWKRPSSVDTTLCILCQERGGKLSKPGTQGMNTLTKATATRRKSKNDNFREVTDRLTGLLNSEPIPALTWHMKCYRPYTDSTKLKRLEPICSSSKSADDEASSSTPSQTWSSKRRSSVAPINWKLCMFCQKFTQQRLRSIMSLELSQSILTDAKFHQTMGIHLSGINDLIAAEGQYHLECLGYFRRSVAKTRSSAGTEFSDVPMEYRTKICSRGHVLCLDDVWNRYMTIAEESNIPIPKSFISRRANFTTKLRSKVEDVITFVVSEGPRSETRTVLLPIKYTGSVMYICQSTAEAKDDDLLTIPPYVPEDDTFISLVHVALKIRGDLMAKEGHKGLSVSEEDSLECIPDSLYLFLNLVFNGTTQLENENIGEGERENTMKQSILSTAQDIVYVASGGKKWTPKHIGLASTLHQATRSKVLVDLFHKAGHTLSYKQVLQLDTALAESTLKSMDPQTGAVMPPNIMQDRFMHFTADNIDILDETLDGKNTFHATQMAVWQRGPSNDVRLNDITRSSTSSQTLKVPDAMDTLIPVSKPVQKTETVLPECCEQDIVLEQSECATRCAREAFATDLTFNILRQRGTVTSSWTVFNEKISSQSQPMTSVGYMPIIQAPAHEYDTLNTVVRRCFQVSAHAGQEFTVLTVDQALYCKLMELKWAHPEEYKNLIPRLGGLHISMNFLNVIGTHMEGSGLAEVWIEAGIFGQNTAQQAMNGKSYKATRAHKLTVQALWRLLGPSILHHIDATDKQMYGDISQADTQDLIGILNSQSFGRIMENFEENRREENVNFDFWWKYIKMVETLLMFTRAQRDGVWDLHLFAFREMLTYFLRYDHYNYGRWGPVYLAEMSQLPADVLTEFQRGKFVVKGSNRRFNQVDPDQAQEWLNGTGKRGGGIVGITKTSSALTRWALSYNLRSHIALETRRMYHMSHTDRHCRNEEMPSRQEKDNTDEQSLVSVFQRFKVFDPTVQPTALQSIVTKDLADEQIQDSLLNAQTYGKQQLQEFVKDRLVIDLNKSSPNKSLYDPITKNNAPTFETLYEVKISGSDKDKTKILKTDRNILQRLIIAYAGGRKVDLDTVLKHELMPVPLALANVNGTLRTGNKAILADVITAEVECPANIDFNKSTACLVIDGQVRVIAVGKPTNAKTFGDLADEFTKSIYNRVLTIVE
ncbi:hypothetical protein BSL78_22450 [Apostichopus japonicus]|uniref:Uncharacterized protein n=1 Tax=Stichopus japonicus TaxID=307972 RepID=A0A2G8JYC5_STIJA|nr:hypothetical protein BSL78_22450 [Apostichopus japonicus]